MTYIIVPFGRDCFARYVSPQNGCGAYIYMRYERILRLRSSGSGTSTAADTDKIYYVTFYYVTLGAEANGCRCRCVVKLSRYIIVETDRRYWNFHSREFMQTQQHLFTYCGRFRLRKYSLKSCFFQLHLHEKRKKENVSVCTRHEVYILFD